MTKPQLFHCLRYSDADRAIKFLTTLGFTERLVVRNPEDSSIVEHAQFQWRENGGIMFGSTRNDDSHMTPGGNTCSLVVESDDQVDEIAERVVGAGAEIVIQPADSDHGGRRAAVRDFDGNLWHIDSYPGE